MLKLLVIGGAELADTNKDDWWWLEKYKVVFNVASQTKLG